MPIAIALFLAVVQGVTELFPISSLGHAVILPAVLHLDIDQAAPTFLPFLVMLHLGTAAALLAYFWRDWWSLALSLFSPAPGQREAGLRLISLIVIATLPAIFIGFVLQKPLEALFAKPWMAAAFLFANGLLLFAGDRLKKRRGPGGGDLSAITWKTALAIGFWQCLAFLPGLSRSGATLVGGVLGGLSYRASAYFSYLIATPVILGAGVLEVPKLLHQHDSAGTLGTAILAGAVACVAAWASVAFLMRYFRRAEFEAMLPFSIYCWLAGAGSLLILSLR